MNLPPQANLLAIHRADPQVLEAIAIDLETSGEFAHVWRPAPGWVAAIRPLPGGEPDSASVRAHGLAFAEGRDVVEGPFVAARSSRLAEAARLADSAPERLASMDGDFGFIRFRPDGTATVVRSCGGLAPFYLSQRGCDFAVSTCLGDLVRYLPEEPRLDPLINGVWAAGHGLFPDRRTFLADVLILNRGFAASMRPGRPVAFCRYWQPRRTRVKRPTPSQAREHAERLRLLLVGKLASDLAAEGGNLLTLSGGVDSSSLAALAVGASNRPVWALSLLPDPEDLYRREMSYIEPLLAEFGIDRHWALRAWHPSGIIDLLSKGPRVVFHMTHPMLCALPEIMQEAPVRVLFGGEFADEVCGSSLTTPDWALQTSVLKLITSVGRLPAGPKDVLRWAKYRALDLVKRPRLPWPLALPDFVRAEIDEEYRAWLERRREEIANDHGHRRHLAMCAEADGFVAMNWEATSALGIRRTFPFFNREVLELAFECHAEELVGPGTKKLLRSALKNDVPRRNLFRSDKGSWGRVPIHVPLSWHAARVPDTLSAVVREEWFPNPPASLSATEKSRMQQLVNFSESMAARRRQRNQLRDTVGLLASMAVDIRGENQHEKRP